MLSSYGSFLESMFRASYTLPHYQYISIPVYKFCGGYDNPFWATFLSCTISDIIVHHVSGRLMYKLLCQLFTFNACPSLYRSGWMSLAYCAFVSVPLSLYKMKSHRIYT